MALANHLPRSIHARRNHTPQADKRSELATCSLTSHCCQQTASCSTFRGSSSCCSRHNRACQRSEGTDSPSLASKCHIAGWHCPRCWWREQRGVHCVRHRGSTVGICSADPVLKAVGAPRRPRWHFCGCSGRLWVHAHQLLARDVIIGVIQGSVSCSGWSDHC